MTCSCTTNTLRLFVRSIAQVDLLSAAQRRASRRLQPQTPLKFSWHASRPYSVSTSRLQEALVQSASIQEPAEPQTFKENERNIPTRKHGQGGSGAIAEFSLEAIDAIAAEAASKGPKSNAAYENDLSYDTPLKSLMKDSKTKTKSRRKEDKPLVRRTKMGTEGPLVRRTKVENTGFKLHYSADPDWEHVDERREKMVAKANKGKPVKPARSEDDWVPPPKEPWILRKEALKQKFPDGYQPLKRLSPDAIAGIRALHARLPDQYTTPVLANEFKVSPEAIAKILKSKWRPSAEEQSDREERWMRRGERIWTRLADMGTKPPKQWRERGIGNGRPDWMKPREGGPKAPLPALITIARRKEAKLKGTRADSLEDRFI